MNTFLILSSSCGSYLMFKKVFIHETSCPRLLIAGFKPDFTQLVLQQLLKKPSFGSALRIMTMIYPKSSSYRKSMMVCGIIQTLEHKNYPFKHYSVSKVKCKHYINRFPRKHSNKGFTNSGIPDRYKQE